MAEYLSPGVYIEEVSGGIKPIEGVGTSTGAFIGIAEKGPIAGARYEDGIGGPVLITNFTEFNRNFGGFIRNEFLAYAVQQFFGEGGSRCYVARTAHFDNPADPSTLTARRASVSLGGISTALAGGLTVGGSGSVPVTVNDATGLQVGMHLFVTDGTNAARVAVVGLGGGNAVTIENTRLDSVGDPLDIPPIANGASVTQVIVDVSAINEGSWGNRLRVSASPSGRVSTRMNMPGDSLASPAVPAGLPPAANQAVLGSVAGINVGMTLFISDGTAAARVQVTGVEEGQNRITFNYIESNAAVTSAGIDDGADVSGTILGKTATVLSGAVANGATEAVLQSTDGIERGSVLLFVAESVGSLLSPVELPSVRESRVVVTQVVGKQVFFQSGLTAAFPDGSAVSTEDFTLTVFDRDDSVETFPFLTMENTNATDYVSTRINDGANRSKYIRVDEAPLLASNTQPRRTAVPLRLGAAPTTDGTGGADDVASDYIGNEAGQTGFFAFDTVDDINIVAAPGITLRPVVLAGMTYCENRGDCFFVGDVSPEAQTVTEVLDFKKGTGPFAGQQGLISKYGALYWPWIRALDPLTGGPITVPPSGAVAGSYSATDVRRGVHKAPAGSEDGFLNTAIGIDKVVTKGEHDLLNPQGVNVIRSFPDIGIVIWGARTTSSDPEWRYVNVRRLFLFLEESIEQGTSWTVFEPNDPILWKRIVRNVSAFLRIQWLEGKLVGAKPDEAFFVKCDEETNPPESVDLGRVITIIGVAPSKPAEFVIFRIMQSRGGANTAE